MLISETLLIEFRVNKKLHHLLNNYYVYSQPNTTEEEKQAGFELFPNNNTSKSPFSGLTIQIRTYLIIRLTNEEGITN